MDKWLWICNIDITKFLSTCNLLMLNSRVCCGSNGSVLSPIVSEFSYCGMLLGCFLVKLVCLKISLICCCWRFWFDMSMSTLSLSHQTFSSIPPKLWKCQLNTLPKTDHFDLYSSYSSVLELSSEIKSNTLMNWDCELVINVEIELTSSMHSA